MALVLPPFCLLVFVIVVPAAQAVLSTLRVEQDGHVVYSLARYAQILHTVSLYRSVAFTLLVTLASAAATFVLAYTLALYLRFSQGRVSTLLGALFILPLFIPTVIASFAMVTFLQNHGFVATLLHYVGVEEMPPLVFNAVGIVLTEVWASIPFATLVLLAGLQGMSVVMTNYFSNYLRPDVSVAMAALSFGIAALAGAAYVVGVSRRERGVV